MAVQGRYFSKDEIHRIIHLLASTDMTVPEIAERMACSRSAIVSINRKFQVRLYSGQRSSWQVRRIASLVPVEEVAKVGEFTSDDDGVVHVKKQSA
jgi:hypothetical protein